MKRPPTSSTSQKRIEPRPEQPRSAPHQPDEIERFVRIEKPIYGGAFMGRVEGKAVFVPLTLPGEDVRVRITEEKRGYAIGEVDEIVAEAPERIAPFCRHFGTCGGCHYQHAGYETQLAFKKATLRETLERGGVRAPEEISLLTVADETQSWAYRNRIRLAFDAQGNPGYRGRRSHSVFPIAECPIAAPLLITAAKAFAEAARQPSSMLRPAEISLFCNAAETSLLASVFIPSASESRSDRERFEDFAGVIARQIPALKGIELAVKEPNGVRTPVQSPRTITQWGEPSLVYRATGFDYRVDHGAFFQVNRWLVDRLVEFVTEGQRGKLAWDLFAGVGLFARKLTASFSQVVAVESAPAAVVALEKNLRGTTGFAVKALTVDFLRRSTETERPDLIVVDPPRTGLGGAIVKFLAEIATPGLIYVSCDPATLARDLRALIASGYAIENLTLADLFPHTYHLETVVQLHRY